MGEMCHGRAGDSGRKSAHAGTRPEFRNGLNKRTISFARPGSKRIGRETVREIAVGVKTCDPQASDSRPGTNSPPGREGRVAPGRTFAVPFTPHNNSHGPS